MVSDDAVAGREHVGKAGTHPPVHGDSAPDAEISPGLGGQAGVGADADHDQDHVGRAGHGRAVSRGGVDLEPSGPAWPGPADLPDRGAGEDLDAASGELGVH